MRRNLLLGYGPKTEQAKPLYSDVVKGNFETQTITIYPENTTENYFKYVPNPMFDPPMDYSDPKPLHPYVSKRGRVIVSGTGKSKNRVIGIVKSKMLKSDRLKLWLNNGTTIMMGTTEIAEQLKFLPQIFERDSKIIWPLNKVILKAKHEIAAIYVDLPIQTSYIIKDYKNVDWKAENRLEWEQLKTEKDMLKLFKIEFRRQQLEQANYKDRKRKGHKLLESIITKYHESEIPMFLSEVNLRRKVDLHIQSFNKSSSEYVYACTILTDGF